MSDLTVSFIGGSSFTIDSMIRKEAEELLLGLTAGPGCTTINGSDGSITLVNRQHITFATFKEATK